MCKIVECRNNKNGHQCIKGYSVVGKCKEVNTVINFNTKTYEPKEQIRKKKKRRK